MILYVDQVNYLLKQRHNNLFIRILGRFDRDKICTETIAHTVLGRIYIATLSPC